MVLDVVDGVTEVDEVVGARVDEDETVVVVVARTVVDDVEVVPGTIVVVGAAVDVLLVLPGMLEVLVVVGSVAPVVDVVGAVLDEDVVGTIEVVDDVVVGPGPVVLVVDVEGVLVELLDADEVDVVDVDDEVLVLVVVAGHCSPQHGSSMFCTTVAAGTICPVRTGAVVRHMSSFSVLAVSLPATVRPVLAQR